MDTEASNQSGKGLDHIAHAMRRLNTYEGSQAQQRYDGRTFVAEGQTFYRPSTAPRSYTQPAYASMSHPAYHALFPSPPRSGDGVARFPTQRQGEPLAEGDIPVFYRSDDYAPYRPRRKSSKGTHSAVSQTSPRSSRRRSSTSSFAAPTTAPPVKPLPALPNSNRTSSQKSTNESFDGSSIDAARYSLSSGKASIPDRASVASSIGLERKPTQTSTHSRTYSGRPSTSTSTSEGSFSELAVIRRKMLIPEEIILKGKKKEGKKQGIHGLEFSACSSTLATKHGNNIVLFWSRADGNLKSTIKITSYTDAKSRGRDYLIHSHRILSETQHLAAIAVKFGVTLEIWNWADHKCLQTITEADRWTAGRFEQSNNPWSQLAVYHGDDGIIDLWSSAGARKKPLAKLRIIHLKKANLPFVPQYPELALSTTKPLLIAVSGPRPPRRSLPPPDKETLLVAWDIRENSQASHLPWKVCRPYHGVELETAIPCDVATYGDIVVSIWIPANFRSVAVRSTREGNDFQLFAQAVPNKIVLIWNLTENTTRAFNIPNVTACISQDCQYVAYCDATNTQNGARGSLMIINAMTGSEVWSWPDRDATARDSGPRRGFEQFADLGRVTELAFSPDSKFLVVGDAEGHTGVYERRDVAEPTQVNMF